MATNNFKKISLFVICVTSFLLQGIFNANAAETKKIILLKSGTVAVMPFFYR